MILIRNLIQRGDGKSSRHMVMLAYLIFKMCNHKREEK